MANSQANINGHTNTNCQIYTNDQAKITDPVDTNVQDNIC